MPDYTVYISRTIVETIEWIVPAADETVARRHAEEYLPLIQDDPEFLAGYMKHRHGYDWVILRGRRKERGGSREEVMSRGRKPSSANPRWLVLAAGAFAALASTPSEAGVQYQCRSIETVCNEYGCSRYCAQWEPQFSPRFQTPPPPERPYYWGDPYYGHPPSRFYERRPAYDRTCYTDKRYRHDHDNRCDKVFDWYGR